MSLEGSDPDLNTVLKRSPNVYCILTIDFAIFSTIFTDFHKFQRFSLRFEPLPGSELLPNAFIFVDFAPDVKIILFREVFSYCAQNTVFRGNITGAWPEALRI